MTLEDVARIVNYSKGHLSKIERGDKSPSASLARQCDALFETGGRLGRLADPRNTSAARGGRMARRDVLATGAGSLLAVTVVGGEKDPRAGGPAAPPVAVFQDQLRLMRWLGQSNAPAALLPQLRTQAAAVTALAAQASGSTRTSLLVIAARFTEYAGWMAQEAGDVAGALGWTAKAVELAQAGGDDHLADYALVRRALIALYNGAARETIALSRRAQESAVPPRIRGLAAQHEAQGHALEGDEKECLKGLDRARDLLTASTAATDTPVLGPTHLPDPVAMVTGWCLHDLGRPRKAAEVLDRECLRIPPHALRTRARYGMRRALAHAASGEVERSCEVARELLGFVDLAPSATIQSDVRRLDRELSRYRAHPTVRDLRPALVSALAAG